MIAARYGCNPLGALLRGYGNQKSSLTISLLDLIHIVSLIASGAARLNGVHITFHYASALQKVSTSSLDTPIERQKIRGRIMHPRIFWLGRRTGPLRRLMEPQPGQNAALTGCGSGFRLRSRPSAPPTLAQWRGRRSPSRRGECTAALHPPPVAQSVYVYRTRHWLRSRRRASDR